MPYAEFNLLTECHLLLELIFEFHASFGHFSPWFNLKPNVIMGLFDKIKITKLSLKYRSLHFFAVGNHA
jgi:hypothetical protein